MRFLRQYLYIFICTLIGVMFVSCTQEESSFSSDDDSVLSLKLHLGTITRATTIDGVDALNENEVSSVDVFLFRADATDADAAIYTASLSSGSITFDAANKTATFDLNVPLGKFTRLFPNGATQCKAYVIVNRPASCTLPALDGCSLSALKHLVVSSSQFQVVDEVEGKRVLTYQPLFVMDGFTENITRNDMTLSGTIAVTRAAVKVQFLINEIADSVADNGTTYTADKDNVTITLRNGCNRAYINETTPASYRKPDKVTDIFNLENISLNSTEGGKLTTSYPMYSYPIYWGNDDASRTYIILTIVWVNDADSTDRRTAYYEVPVNAAGDYLMRNTFYKIIQEVDIIGSETIDDATILYPSSYVILPWGNTKVGGDDTDTDAEISKLRYLVLEESEVQMYNTTHKELFYYTSDPVEIRNLVIQKVNVSNNIATTDPILSVETPNFNSSTNRYEITDSNLKSPLYLSIHTADPNVATDHDYISLSHDLVNNMDAASDYTEYIFTFDVVHKDRPEYKESVRVEQFPMIAIKADQNYDFRLDGNDNENTAKGYVIINNQNEREGWSGVNGLATDDNRNPNRYIISVTSLTEEAGNKYIIGDPRTKTVSNPTGLAEDDNGESLQYYYPADASSAAEDMISPEFMVASSYGRCPYTITDKADVVRRCAAYQEDGYPAGRWRLPTTAEIEYIIQLSGWDVIPTLFSTGIGYWSASGCIQVDANGNVSDFTGGGYWGGGTQVVRCVYDTWYWGTDHDAGSTKFVYGDKQR